MFLIGCTKETEGGCDAGVPALLYTEAHEVGLHILLLQLFEVGSKLLAEDAQEGVVLGGRSGENLATANKNQEGEEEMLHIFIHSFIFTFLPVHLL